MEEVGLILKKLGERTGLEMSMDESRCLYINDTVVCTFLAVTMLKCRSRNTVMDAGTARGRGLARWLVRGVLPEDGGGHACVVVEELREVGRRPKASFGGDLRNRHV